MPWTFVTSNLSGYVLPLIRLAEYSAPAILLEHIMTVAPLSANSLDISKPRPLLEPLIIATLSFSTENIYATRAIFNIISASVHCS
jgi:hypothetical protein